MCSGRSCSSFSQDDQEDADCRARVLETKYKLSVGDMTVEAFLEELAQLLFWGDVNQAANWVMQDYRVVKFGWIALERPPSSI